MPKMITLESHLTTEQLYKRYRTCQKSNEKPRWRALYLISSGIRAAESARSGGRTSGWVSQLTARYNLDGASAVADRRDYGRKPGAVPTVTAELAVKLETALQSNAADGGVWTAKKAALWIEQQTGRKLHAGECVAGVALARFHFADGAPGTSRASYAGGAIRV